MDDFHFTEIFLNLSPDPYRNFGQYLENNFPPPANPFIFITTYYQAFGHPWELYNSKDAYQQYFAVKAEEEKSLATVELESALLWRDDKPVYVNGCLTILIELLQQFSAKEKTTYDNYDSILVSSAENLFVAICRKFPLILNASIRDYYFFLTTIEKPIHSFKFSKFVSDDHFKKLFNEHLKHYPFRDEGFVDSKLEPYVFRTLFDGGRLEQKINWVDNKNSLCYFIRLLNKHKIIKKHKVSHWKVVAEFFLVKGEPLKPEKLLNQPPPKNKKKCLRLENFVKLL